MKRSGLEKMPKNEKSYCLVINASDSSMIGFFCLPVTIFPIKDPNKALSYKSAFRHQVSRLTGLLMSKARGDNGRSLNFFVIHLQWALASGVTH